MKTIETFDFVYKHMVNEQPSLLIVNTELELKNWIDSLDDFNFKKVLTLYQDVQKISISNIYRPKKGIVLGTPVSGSFGTSNAFYKTIL